MACLFGHKWEGCKCTKCGKTRDEGHSFLPVTGKCEEKCSVCGKTRETAHQWNACRCERCGATRGDAHDYQPVPGSDKKRCVYCGKEESTFTLDEFESYEKGLIDMALTLFERFAEKNSNNDAVEMAKAYKERLNQNDSFTYSELCDMGLALDFVIKNLGSGTSGSAAEQGAVIMMKSVYKKLAEYLGRISSLA